MSTEHIRDVHQLIHCIGSAFYTDTEVVFLDCLIRRVFVLEEEIGAILKIPSKEAKRVAEFLLSEYIIRKEELKLDDGRRSTAYYVDYDRFVKIVQLRVHFMQQELLNEELELLRHKLYRCPSCSRQYNDAEASRYVSKDFVFVCPICFQGNYSATSATPESTLIEVNNEIRLLKVQPLREKVTCQLSFCINLHFGILELIERLKHVNLPNNLPSENYRRGIARSVAIQSLSNDSRSMEELLAAQTNAKARSSSRKRKLNMDDEEEKDEEEEEEEEEVLPKDEAGREFQVVLESEVKTQTAGTAAGVQPTNALLSFVKGKNQVNSGAADLDWEV